ncbi:MAG: methionyl aminopeptidase [Pelagibacterales bacterium]|nr:methionyl aminopeptidase [Pelagibacterales bacterium]
MGLDYKENFEQIKIAGSLGAGALDEVTPYVKPGISTSELDKICYEFIKDNGGYSAPLFYRGFPKSCCTSVNHIVCHGIPTTKYLNDGDIINIDVTAIVNGWHGDTSRMFYSGDVSIKSKNLISTTYESMMKAISIIKSGTHIGDIGAIIQTYAEQKGFSIVRDFCGHGTGKIFHEPPNILHYGKKGEGLKLTEGMIFTVEPMINEGLYNTKMLKDGWTAVTKDKSLSAQFEHTIGVTKNGCEIFTKSKKEYKQPPYLI